jgi:hypothetical protein
MQPREASSRSEEAPATEAGSTLADVHAGDVAVAGRPWRLAAITALSLVVLLGAAGLFGVRSRTVSASGGGYDLSLTYPRVARAGLDVPWHVTLRHEGGFQGQRAITLAVTARYFDIYETQGFHPEPDTETRDGEFLYLSFTPPPAGDVFELDFDTYVQPSSQIGRHADLWLVQGGRHRVVGVSFSTWLVP